MVVRSNDITHYPCFLCLFLSLLFASRTFGDVEDNQIYLSYLRHHRQAPYQCPIYLTYWLPFRHNNVHPHVDPLLHSHNDDCFSHASCYIHTDCGSRSVLLLLRGSTQNRTAFHFDALGEPVHVTGIEFLSDTMDLVLKCAGDEQPIVQAQLTWTLIRNQKLVEALQGTLHSVETLDIPLALTLNMLDAR